MTEEIKNTETEDLSVQKAENNEVANKVTANDPLAFLDDLGFTAEELAEVTGMDNLKASDISIPYATLMSKDSDSYAKGDIVLPNGDVIKGWTEEGKKAGRIEGITILNIQPVRIMFPSPFKPTNSYICRSIDGEVGAPDGEYAGQACATCEFAQYPEGGGASPCRDQRLLLCATEDQVFQIIVGGVGMKVFRNFMTQQLLHSLPKVRNLWLALNLNLSVSRVETDFGPFPALNFELDKKKPINDGETIKDHIGLLKSYKEFATEHFDSAAQAAGMQMAAGEESGEGSGENTDLF